MILLALPGTSIMADTGSTLMAKKRATTAKEGQADERVAVVVLKDSVAYKEWVDGISRDSLIPVASIFRDAVSKWAAQRGYPPPPGR